MLYLWDDDEAAEKNEVKAHERSSAPLLQAADLILQLLDCGAVSRTHLRDIKLVSLSKCLQASSQGPDYALVKVLPFVSRQPMFAHAVFRPLPLRLASLSSGSGLSVLKQILEPRLS